ncbi:MAG: ATP-binding cassette domain-containing protein [Planctomycetota bacterium]|jgi:ABC-type nitrate/sulfonate/bicarbonate transport system ATPase subunit|nr:ATP-binding cassette domain-containing protein [Planctomycetota bacterium]
MTHPILNIQQLCKSFGEQSVLHGLDMQLEAGQRIAILGESGCGKSTLLRVISGLEEYNSGQVTLEHPRRCLMVFQDLGLWPSHTSMQQLIMAAKASKIDDAAAKAEHLLEQLQISHIADRKPATLSGGEARRLAFARVLICQPKLILLDEAFSSLDADNRQQGIELLQEVLALSSAAVIMVTHNQDDATQLDFPIFDLVGGQLLAR